jgi:gluconolactonase
MTFMGVYRVSPDLGTMTLLVADFLLPNGVALSPHESVLYINDSSRRHIRAFALAPNGTLARQRKHHQGLEGRIVQVIDGPFTVFGAK